MSIVDFEKLFAHYKDVTLMSFLSFSIDVVRCGIWYHSYNLKNVKNTHGGVLISVRINIPPWGVFHLF